MNPRPCQKKSVKELSAIVVNAKPTMNLEPSTLYVFLPEEHNLAPWNTKVLFKIRSSVRGTIKGIRGNLEEWNILQCTWGLFHISKMCKGSHRMVREWGVNVQLLFQRRSGPQSSISRFPEVVIQVAFHDRLAWIVPHLSIKKLDEKIWLRTLRILTLPPNWSEDFAIDWDIGLKSVVNHLNEEFPMF